MGRATFDSLITGLQDNCVEIVEKSNHLLREFGSSRKISSGYRRLEDNLKVPDPKIHSQHLICSAIDLEDHDGKLHEFCLNNNELLESLDLYCETRQGGWQHMQLFAPKSRKRWFIP